MRQRFALVILALAIPALGLQETQSHHQRRRLTGTKGQTSFNQTSTNTTHQAQPVFLNHRTESKSRKKSHLKAGTTVAHTLRIFRQRLGAPAGRL